MSKDIGEIIANITQVLERPQIVYVFGIDWDAFYINGKLVAQGHTFLPRDVLEMMEEHAPFGADQVCYLGVDDEWLEHEGEYPELLLDVAFEENTIIPAGLKYAG